MFKKVFAKSAAGLALKKAQEVSSDIKSLSGPDKTEFLGYLGALNKEMLEYFNFNDLDDLRLIASKERDFARRSLRNYTEALAHGFFATYAEAKMHERLPEGKDALNLLDPILDEVQKKEDPLGAPNRKAAPPTAGAERSIREKPKDIFFSIMRQVADEPPKLKPVLDQFVRVSISSAAAHAGVLTTAFSKLPHWVEYWLTQAQEDNSKGLAGYELVLKDIELIYEGEEDLVEQIVLCFIYLYIHAEMDRQAALAGEDNIWPDTDFVIRYMDALLNR